MKSKWIPWLVIMNVVFIIALISVVGILMIDKREEVKTEDRTQEVVEPAATFPAPQDDSAIIDEYNRKYGSKYDIVISIKPDSTSLSQVKKVMVILGILQVDKMEKAGQTDEMYKIMKNVRDDLVKDFGQVSVTFRVGWENAPFYMFDTNGAGHKIPTE